MNLKCDIVHFVLATAIKLEINKNGNSCLRINGMGIMGIQANDRVMINRK